MNLSRAMMLIALGATGVVLAGSDSDAKQESAMKEAHQTSQSIEDVRTQTRLTTTYELNEVLRPFQLDVQVDDGVTRVSGTVRREVERELAETIAENLEGVSKLESQIDIQPEYEGEVSERGFGKWVSDATATARVKLKLLMAGDVSGMKINVDTDRGVATLIGQTDSEASRLLAGELAADVRGITEVDNQLTVAAAGEKQAKVAAEEGSAGTSKPGQEKGTEKGEIAALEDSAHQGKDASGDVIDDSWITGKVKTKLAKDEGLGTLGINVNTKDGRVELLGAVDSEAQRQKLSELVMEIEGVKEVNTDKLEVKPD